MGIVWQSWGGLLRSREAILYQSYMEMAAVRGMDVDDSISLDELRGTAGRIARVFNGFAARVFV